MDQEFYFEESNPHKTKKIIIVLILLFILVCGGFFYFRSKYTLNIKKNLKFEAGSILPSEVSAYVKNKVIDENDYTLMMESVTTEDNVLTKVGEYSFKIKYKNITKSGKLKVVDTVAPRVEVSELTIGVDEEFEVDDFITVCEDYSKPCSVSYDNQNDEKLTKEEGTHNFKINISDSVGNTIKRDVVLNVKKGYSAKENKESDLKTHHIDPDFSDWNNDIIIKFDKGYDPNEIDETDVYGELMELSGDDLHKYLDPLYMNNEIREKQIIQVYNKYGLVIGYAIRVKLDNGLYLYCKK